MTGTTILKAIKDTVDPSTQVVFNENPDPALINSEDFEYAIVVVGEQPYAETNGDNLNLTLPAPGPDIIKNVCSHIKCVVVVISGRPLVIDSKLKLYGYRSFKKKVTIFSLKKPKKINTVTN